MFRVALWYAGLFGVLSLVVFMVVCVSLLSGLNHRTDNDLVDSSKEFKALYRTSGTAALQQEFQREATPGVPTACSTCCFRCRGKTVGYFKFGCLDDDREVAVCHPEAGSGAIAKIIMIEVSPKLTANQDFGEVLS